jgi:hypothetical protein
VRSARRRKSLAQRGEWHLSRCKEKTDLCHSGVFCAILQVPNFRFLAVKILPKTRKRLTFMVKK